MTTADEIRAWTTNQERTRLAYYRDAHCATCGAPKATNTATRCRRCTSLNARPASATKAEAQRLYRLRKKEEGQ